MATVDVSVPSDVAPQQAWKLASDLNRFDEWMTIFAGWRGPVPETIAEGTEVSSLIKVKGFRNTIHWRVTRYDEPHTIELTGTGWPAVKICITMNVTDADGRTCFHLISDISGGVLNGPIGRLVAKVLESDVRKSVSNLAALA
ncbi:type II toxin-antitoxin system Rv0910 family toxin [Mycolicibacterium pallens]|uniref:SRPBCC family protein n=1 Tax=Mycolicibacterium pallens TaxID=370524 RepID=A0ABX8VJ91_9MYCO|nr:SRPBCC family protein [Mycolicibacterium pallens]APE18465.1 polyketide cyclase / dehydrase and lipid transport [Mycobacterium sp. WY10]QYL16051.1 SRPBCC family protein [Mycolicibacterium pallens]